MDDRFSAWLLRGGLGANSLNSYMSRLRAIEASYGDVDAAYDADGFAAILGDMAYTSSDERDGRANPCKVQINSHLYKSLASLRTVLRRYADFRDVADSDDGLNDGFAETADVASLGLTDGSANDLSFRYEQDLQTALIACIGQIEPGMTLAEGGKEHVVASGRIDALARDNAGRPVVIELKAVTARREVLGQIAAYMADIEDTTGTRSRGILIAPDFDPRLVSGARMVAGLSLMRYAFSFSFAPVTAAPQESDQT